MPFSSDLLGEGIEHYVKASRENVIIDKSNVESDSILFCYLERRYKQSFDKCDLPSNRNASSKSHEFLLSIMRGDCVLFNREQQDIIKAYTYYLEALTMAQNIKSNVLHVESLNKLITYNLFSGNNLKETEHHIETHRSMTYDSLEYLRNEYYQLRLRTLKSRADSSLVEPYIYEWRDLLQKCAGKYFRLETELRSVYALRLERLKRLGEAKDQFLLSLESSKHLGEEYYNGIIFSSMGNLGILEFERGNLDEALDRLRQALSVPNKMESDGNLSSIYKWLSKVFREKKQIDSAYHYLNLSYNKNKNAREAEHSTAIKEIQSKYDNEKLSKDLSIEQTKRLQTRFWLFLFIGISTILLLIYQNATFKKNALKKEYENSKLKQEFQKQAALQNERNRIAGEMHDDLGGGLTTIKFVCQRVLRNVKDEEDKNLLNKVVQQSTLLVNNMSEIIWAMNSSNDSLENLLAYIRRYSNEYLSNHEIKFDYKLIGDASGIELSGEKRRHLFLIVKEVLHNVVKHSEADIVILEVKVDTDLEIKIKDNGIGFEKDRVQLGNGIKNIEKRIKTLGGKVILNSENGVSFIMAVPLTFDKKVKK